MVRDVYSFDMQTRMAIYLSAVWVAIFAMVVSLVCNHKTGCLSCMCLKDEPPTLEEVLYNHRDINDEVIKTRIKDIYENMNYKDERGRLTPKFVHQNFYRNSSCYISGRK